MKLKVFTFFSETLLGLQCSGMVHANDISFNKMPAVRTYYVYVLRFVYNRGTIYLISTHCVPV